MKGDKVGTQIIELIIILLILSFLAIALSKISLFFVDITSFVPPFLARIIDIIKFISTIIVMFAIAVIIYSFMRINEITSAQNKKLGLSLDWSGEKKQKNERWERVEQYMASANPSDWKIAILEADNILDQVVERIGYQGDTLGERLKQIEASDFPYLNEAWQAHKMRNAIAHKGTDYQVTRSDAEQTINIYHRIFRELGYL